jgi:hypothetical protein
MVRMECRVLDCNQPKRCEIGGILTAIKRGACRGGLHPLACVSHRRGRSTQPGREPRTHHFV